MFDNDSQPIYIQIAQDLEHQILSSTLAEGDQVLSTTQYSTLYRINPATVAKGFSLLIDGGILEKRRGIGTFVAAGARDRLNQRAREAFVDDHLAPLIKRASDIGMTPDALINLIRIHFTELTGRTS
ncbi:GntR family transcriptional regulator [Schaalia sp. Marseille-Q2122]|uniref:GntR family transcriptional regulator n=1 Tax=Schaalia sp. Marseille-Q2122 TaxID=2736604 RepID=UPI00158F2A34|nr:GntR family transcriptional regulator [Schaalia sp. Marseille-Q2122]